MRLTELHVQGFKSLVDAKIPLRPLMVMIGSNGSGKTALLEVLQLLQRGAQGKLEEAVERFSGINAILSKTPPAPDRLKVTLTAVVESEEGSGPIHYGFELSPRGAGYVVSSERLEWWLDPSAFKPYSFFNARYGSVNQFYSRTDFPDMGGVDDELNLSIDNQQGTWLLRNAFTKTLLYGFLDVSSRSVVRLPQTLTPAPRPGSNGENLYSTLYNLRDAHPDIYERVEDTLRTGFPGFRNLAFPVVGAGQVTMTWHQDDLTMPLYPNQLSEGTLRFLWLTTILLAPDPPPIILIDEPEVSLHPQLLMLLAGLLQDAALRQQVIVATHSSDLIHWLKPDEVVVLDKVDGRTQFTWADTLNLEEWLDEFTLRDLWLMGNLGGRS